MKNIQWFLLWMIIIFPHTSSTQSIYSQGFAIGTGMPELQRINLVDYTLTRLAGMGDMGDIAFHPDQRLFGVVFDKVYLIDTITSAFTEVYDIGDFQSVGMTIDYKGIMYFSGYDPATNRYGIAIFNPATSATRIVADFGPINQGFINDLEFYNGQLYVAGELPAGFVEPAVLFRVDTSGLNQHDTIVQYNKWPGRALASVSDTCGAKFLVSPATSVLNYFYPPMDSVHSVDMFPAGGLFYSSGATSRTSHLGSLPLLDISEIKLLQDPCTGNSNAFITVVLLSERPTALQYSIDGTNYQDTNFFTNIPPGLYQIHVRDGWGCQVSEAFEVIDRSAFPVTLELTPATCGMDNGVVQINSSAQGLHYSMDDQNFTNDVMFPNLTGGDHQLVIRDDAGCVDTMMLSLQAYPAPAFNTLLMPEQCQAQNGIIEFINVTGEEPLQYSLDGLVWQSLSSFENLYSGAYTLYVLDVFNCIVQDDIILPETGQPVITDMMVTESQCEKNDGAIQIFVVSEHGPLQYSIGAGAFKYEAIFDSLAASSYLVMVRDTFGCTTMTEVIVSGKGAPIILNLDVSPEYCGLGNGKVIIAATSDHGPLRYSIDSGTFLSNEIFKDLVQGDHVVTILDTNGCQIQTLITIDSVSGTPIQSVITDDETCGLENGRIEILSDALGVTGYSINNKIMQQGSIFENLTSGFYSVSLMSYEGCLDSAFVTINEHPAPVVEELIITPSSCVSEPASVLVTVYSESEVLYSFDQLQSQEEGYFTDIKPGLHEIIISDAFGCETDTSFVIDPVQCSFYIPNVFSPNGDGVNDFFHLITEKEDVEVRLFKIYDRWGNEAFTCITNGCSWDGNINDQRAAAGVYLYQIIFIENTEPRHLNGQITLLR